MKAILKYARITPKKANLIASLVRNKKATEALDILKFTPKKAAGILKKLIASAVANAENNFKQTKDALYIKEIIVNDGPMLKRSVPISRGRMHPILKRMSHISVKLEVQEKKEIQAKPEKQEEKSGKKPKKDQKPEKISSPKTK